jgi:hypothetical protein
MKYLRPIIIIVICLIIPLSAERAFDITDIGTSAESVAGGGVHTISNTAHSIFLNPALLDHDINWSVDVFQTQTLEDVKINNISISKSYNNSSFGLGYTWTGMDGIQGAITSNSEIVAGETYEYNHSKFYLGGKMQLNKFFSTGVTLKLMTTRLGSYSGKGMNSDVGLLFQKPSYNIALGIHNILRMNKMTYTNHQGSALQDEEFPFKLFINASKQMTIKSLNSRLHLQLNQYDKHPMLYSGGFKINHQKFPFLEGLLGYRHMFHLDKTIGRKSIGLNLNIKGIKLSYAYERSETPIFDNMHYTSLSFSKLARSRTLSKP